MFWFLIAAALFVCHILVLILRLDLLSLLLRGWFHYIHEISSFLQRLKRMNLVLQLLLCLGQSFCHLLLMWFFHFDLSLFEREV